MNLINFNQIGGFPLSTNILAKLQTAFSIFNALGNIVGDKTIISGCIVNGLNVADGVVYVNGEVLEFRGGLTQTKVIIKEDSENLIFQNGNSYPSIKTRYATFGTGVGAMDWIDFKQGFATKDIAAGLIAKADKSSFDALAAAFTLVFEKMLTIDVGAEKNVQADLDETDPAKDSFVKGQTATLKVLHKGSFAIADFSTDSIQTVNFPNIGTNNYMVLGSLKSNSSNFNNDNDVFEQTREYGNTSFKLCLREVSGGVQDLTYNYILIPL